jgi:acetyl-CoA carboxylase biotin carboxyl carrier protein
MDSELIKSLIAALAASDLSELEYTSGGETLRLTKRAGAGPVASPVSRPVSRPAAAPETTPEIAPKIAPKIASDIAPEEIRSPLYGVVHLRPAPDAAPFAAIGEHVRAGQTLCVIEAMKVFNELRAGRDGTLRDVLVESGQEVDVGQPLFRLD